VFGRTVNDTCLVSECRSEKRLNCHEVNKVDEVEDDDDDDNDDVFVWLSPAKFCSYSLSN